MKKPCFTLADLRKETLGYTYKFNTPYGERFMTYADYIASGRNLRFFERYLLNIEESYANTHTEDDITGKSTTELLHLAEDRIKAAVNGDESTCIISTGTGATGAVQKLQEILGITMPPHTRARLDKYLGDQSEDFWREFQKQQPVVFVSAYEHHSNEVTWRESQAEVVEIALTEDGLFDLDDLRQKVSKPEYRNRQKIGSFSAASNVTGIVSPLFEIAEIMHEAGGIVCFDFAASAPYVKIDINHSEKAYFDAIFVSPHKFLGGPGANGLLLFREELYRKDLPPTCGGGGTVDYVSPTLHDFIDDIEVREKAGTPGTLQVIKAALAFDLKDELGIEEIEKREHSFIQRAMERFKADKNIEILGNDDPEKRISIISFNIRYGERYLHPKFVTRLLNDLFGVQSRAGCSCAGPYGHHLLKIDDQLSRQYRELILEGFNALKPGWVRVGFHYTLSEEDFKFICDSISFVAENGGHFLPLYAVDMKSGAWKHVDDKETPPKMPTACAAWEFSGTSFTAATPDAGRKGEYERYLDMAADLAEDLKGKKKQLRKLSGKKEELRFFEFINAR